MKNQVVTRTQSRAVWRTAALAVPLLLIIWLAGAAIAGPAAEKSPPKEHRVIVKAVDEGANEGPYLGVTMQELDEHLRQGLDVKVKTGVLVSQVIEGSPAAEGGMEDGDIIVEFDGKRVDSPEGLKTLVGDSKAGEKVKVKVVRDGDPKTLTVTIGEWPEEESFSFEPEKFIQLGEGKNWFMSGLGQGRLGVQATDLNGDLAPYFGVKEGEGALVLEVMKGSVAEDMGVKSGDIITKVKDNDVGSVKDLVGAVGDLEGGEKFDLTLVRSNKTLKLQGEAGENNIEKTYRKVLRITPDSRDSKLKIEKLHGMSDAEIDKLKEDMNELRKELKNLKEELEKVKEST